MEQRDSFVFYRSFYEAIKDLDDAKKTTLFDAICDLALNGNEPKNDPKFDTKFDAVVNSIFTLIKPQILANTERYKNRSKK